MNRGNSKLFGPRQRADPLVGLARATGILGIVGGVLGLVTSGFGLLLSLVLLAVTFGGATFLFLPILVSGLAAVFGIVGGAVAFSKAKAGGWILIAGVTIGLAGWLVSASVAFGSGLSAVNLFFLVLVFFVWWALLMLIGGLLAVTRKEATSTSRPNTSPVGQPA